MKYNQLGKTELQVSQIGMGCAELGFNSVSIADGNLIFAEALDSGINLFDTAAAYLDSEKILGKLIKGQRNKVIISTKCGFYDGFSKSDWSKNGIAKSVENSLSNLGTDYIDVLLLHSCSAPEFLWAEAGAALQEARQKGQVRYIGYSGDGAPALQAINSGMFDVLETSINIADQEAIDLLLPAARHNGIGVIVKRPVANTVWINNELPTNDYHQEYWRRLQKLDYNFLNEDISEAVKKSLLFTLSQKGVHTAITGASRPGRLSQNSQFISDGINLPADLKSYIGKRWKEVSDITWTGQV